MKRLLVVSLIGALSAAAASAQNPATEDLQQQLVALKAELARLSQGGSEAERLAELERRIDLLASAVEQARTGGATEIEAPAKGEPGFGPAASKVYRRQRGVSIGGYGEALYQNFASERQNGSPSGARDRADLLRVVFYTGYKFSDRILFNSEVEYEHATTGEGAEERGEITVEQAYLEFKPWKKVGVRAGMVLVPLGFVNELHEPPIFLGARRPDVERVIVPSTWHDVGVGLFGESGPFQWRGYAVASLDAAGLSAGGIRDARQGGSESLAENFALTGRLDFVGVPGLVLGTAGYTGKTGQGASVAERALEARVTLFELHAQYEQRGFQGRVLYARTKVDDAAAVNALNGLSGRASVGSKQYGFYAEAGYDLMTLRPCGQWAVLPFVRYERFDTQHEVPAGFTRDPARDRKIWTAGLSVKPLTGVVLKADYQWMSNRARSGTNQLNLAVGFLF
jgi:hypothetical protein